MKTRRSFFGLLLALAIPVAAEARGGCGSRGGPGYRKSNGKCATKKDKR